MNCNQHGLIRLFRSSKAYAALTGSVLAILPVGFAWPSMDPAMHAAAAQALATKLMALWGAVIVMTGVEDAATNATTSGDSNTVSVSSPVSPTPAGAPTAQIAATVAAVKPASPVGMRPSTNPYANK